MKMLLTGAGGLLGSAIAAAAGPGCAALAREQVWGRTPAALAELLAGHDVLVHAAANTNVEQCERDPATCYRDNLLLTELLARAAAVAGVRCAFISSTGIYGTTAATPYREYDTPAPTTHHHRSKYLAEQAVLALAPANLVLRTGWLFGGAPASPKNFVARRLDEARAALADGRALQANAEQRGNPSFVGDVAAQLLLLLEQGHAGVFNCVNDGTASRHEYVRAIVALAGLPLAVEPIGAGAFQRRAPVSPNEMADNWKMRALGLPAMPAWQDSLARYLHTLPALTP